MLDAPRSAAFFSGRPLRGAGTALTTSLLMQAPLGAESLGSCIASLEGCAAAQSGAAGALSALTRWACLGMSLDAKMLDLRRWRPFHIEAAAQRPQVPKFCP